MSRVKVEDITSDLESKFRSVVRDVPSKHALGLIGNTAPIAHDLTQAIRRKTGTRIKVRDSHVDSG